MARKRKYTEERLGEIKNIADFLPAPEESVKVTLTLSKKSVDFFKAEAAKDAMQYQRMIRKLLDEHVARLSSKRLAELGGTEPQLKSIARRR